MSVPLLYERARPAEACGKRAWVIRVTTADFNGGMDRAPFLKFGSWLAYPYSRIMISERRDPPDQPSRQGLRQARARQETPDTAAVPTARPGMVDAEPTLHGAKALRQRLHRSRAARHFSRTVEVSYPAVEVSSLPQNDPPSPAPPMSRVQALIQSIGQMLPPGTVLVVLAAELPDGRTLIKMPAPSSIEGIAEKEVTDSFAEHRAASAPSTPETPLARVAALRAKHGIDAPLKLRDWHAEVGISTRELKRAVKHGAIPAGRKSDGRDNKATTITIGAMEAYLRTVDAVERGVLERPVWWTEVRGAQAAA